MMTFLIVAIVLILIMDGYVTAAKTVFSRMNSSKHSQDIFNDSRKADRIRNLFAHSPRVDTALTLYQMICRLASGGLMLGLVWYERPAAWSGWIVLYLFGLALIITILEWAASLLIMKKPLKQLVNLSGLINILYQTSKPFFSWQNLFFKDLLEKQRKMDQVSEDDLKSLVDESQKNGLLEVEEQKMIHSVFRLDDTLAREIMVPRIDIQAIDASMPFSEAIKHFIDSGYSRIPVYKEKIDQILGLLYAKDLLEVYSNGTYQGGIAELVRDAYYVPETKIINELLTDMQKKRIHLAIVVDEYGGVSGLVTLEDIMEEIFGEIQDEYDEEEGLYLTVAPGEYIFQGKIDIDDLNLILNSNLPNNEADTLAGLIYFQLGHVPKRGEVVKLDNLLLKVEQVHDHRIIKVRIKNLTVPPAREEDEYNDPV